MKIVSTTALELNGVLELHVERFFDERGYFTEVFNKADIANIQGHAQLAEARWHQMNESYSQRNVARGLHFQWSPHLGKLIRCVAGSMVDLVLDIRKDSPTLGKILALPLSYNENERTQSLIFIPPGFAHGFYATENCRIEYFCTDKWSKDTERSISLMAEDIDWSLVKKTADFNGKTTIKDAMLNEKDTKGLSLSEWLNSEDCKTYHATL